MPDRTDGRANPLAVDLDHLLESGAPIWGDLRGARLFITGGTGFVGRWILESFVWVNDELDLGAEAVVLTRDPARARARAPHLARPDVVTLLEGDIRSFAFPDGDFSHVLHMATETDTATSSLRPSLEFDTAVDGTRRVLEFAASRRVGALLYTSSGAVYGRQPAELARVAEESSIAPPPQDARASYAHAKRAAEFLCCAAHQEVGLEARIARLFAFVGPHLPMDAGYAAGNFIRDAIAGGPIRVSGDGTPLRSYLYAGDLALWLWTVLLRGASARPYNIGSDREISIVELARTVARSLDPSLAVEVAGSPAPGIPPQRYVPDTSRAAQELGLRPTVTLEEGIRRTAAWHSASIDDGQAQQ
jgi:dTDP-glucose 4,6-dehydratase